MAEPAAVARLNRDLKAAADTLSQTEARYLVDAYYTIQLDRMRSADQVRALGESAEPHAIIDWLAQNTEVLENQIKRALDAYTKASELGLWSREVKGIGPVIAAGLLAHIDITRAPTAGHIWRFAGLDPTTQWKKGKKRPWNAQLKTLCWKIGESFVKVSGDKEAFYAQLYLQRKALEQQRNEAGIFADQAAAVLKAKNIGKTTDAYKAYSTGLLSRAHIHARAKRYAVKIFLSHWHEKAYALHYGKAPPAPYPIAILGHAHKI